MASTNTEKIEKFWSLLARFPGGRKIFSALVAFYNPYAGSMGAVVETLEPGHCRATLQEKRRVKNPYNSVHAVALTNLGELTAGLAFNYGLPSRVRAIPVNLNISFFKKARGKITCDCYTGHPTLTEDHDFLTSSEMTDATGAKVATLVVTWRVSPR